MGTFFSKQDDTTPDYKERYKAAMVLGAVGDALGYNNGKWEFCRSGKKIYAQFESLGGFERIHIKAPAWQVSDDTIMLLATSEGLTECDDKASLEDICTSIARKYKDCLKEMQGRAPGNMCLSSIPQLDPNVGFPDGFRVPFDERAGGCGAAMRSMCIGLRYAKEEMLTDLIAISIETGWMTHHHPTGYLGSLASALFASYAIQGRPLREWGAGLLESLPEAYHYVQSQQFYCEENEKNWNYFQEKWNEYLCLRQCFDGQTDPVFPEKFGMEERDTFYAKISYSGWGGSSGHDAPMIAYDALLGAGKDWKEVCKRAMLHGGDSDSTGIIAGFCYGALYGFDGVPNRFHEDVEFNNRLTKQGLLLLEKACPNMNMEQLEVGKKMVNHISYLHGCQGCKKKGDNRLQYYFRAKFLGQGCS